MNQELVVAAPRVNPGVGRSRSRAARAGRRALVGMLSALVAGVLMGAVARVMMRLATVAAGEAGHFSLGGTVGIIVAFVVVAVPGAVLAAVVARRGRSLLLVAGALLLCGPAAGIAGSDLGGLDGLSTEQLVGVGLATAGVFGAILLLPLVTLRAYASLSRVTGVAGA